MNIIKQIGLLSISTVMCLAPLQAIACAEHYFFNQNASHNFLGSGASSRFNRPVVQPKIFKVKHKSAAFAVVDKDHQLEIGYELPSESKNVSLQLTATNSVQLIDKEIKLTETDGKVTAKYRVSQKGVDMITVTISGEHEGQTLSYISRVYVNTKEV